MNEHLAIIGAILKKDVKLVWPFALALAVAQILLRLFDDELVNVGGFGLGLAAFAVEAGFFFVGVFVVQQEPFTSDRHDWRTRPLPKRDVVAAKLLFLTLIAFVPAFLGSFAWGLHHHLGLAGALEYGFSVTWKRLLTAVLPLLTIGVMTPGILSAVGLIAAVTAGTGMVSIVATLAAHAPPQVGGGMWIVGVLSTTVTTVAALVAIALQMARRKWLARVAFILIWIGSVATIYIPSEPMLRLQNRLTGGAEAAPQGLTLTAAVDCVQHSETTMPPGQEAFFEGIVPQWKLVAAVSGTGLPAGWRLLPDHLEGEILSADGALLATPLRTATGGPLYHFATDLEPGGVNRFRDLLPIATADYKKVSAAPVKLRLAYDFTLLEPVQSWTVPNDGALHVLPGLGQCRTRLEGSKTKLACLVRNRPAYIEAEAEGHGRIECSAGNGICAPDYGPRGPFGRYGSINVTLDKPELVPSVRIIGYRARGRFHRSVDSLAAPLPAASPACRTPAMPGAANVSNTTTFKLGTP